MVSIETVSSQEGVRHIIKNATINGYKKSMMCHYLINQIITIAKLQFVQ